MTPKDLAKIAYKALDDKKGINIKVIDITEISVIADYFIIAGGSNDNQVKAMADNVIDEMTKEKIKPNHIEGIRSSNWILMDYGDVLIHVFKEEERLFYDLERIWRDGNLLTKEEL